MQRTFRKHRKNKIRKANGETERSKSPETIEREQRFIKAYGDESLIIPQCEEEKGNQSASSSSQLNMSLSDNSFEEICEKLNKQKGKSFEIHREVKKLNRIVKKSARQSQFFEERPMQLEDTGLIINNKAVPFIPSLNIKHENSKVAIKPYKPSRYTEESQDLGTTKRTLKSSTSTSRRNYLNRSFIDKVATETNKSEVLNLSMPKILALQKVLDSYFDTKR